ncbi:MAG: 50S ribosomal protein L4 [Candidatus Nanohaloarchaeota archaeon QJJ-9]|nr:50S ribosomal protein L4 [Candidatus Nanohaloarchaeota archaeon QJJ-9]
MTEVKTTEGEKEGEVELPAQFNERVRDDIVKKAVLSIQSKNRQSYGADKKSGLQHVTQWRNRNRAYRSRRGKSYPSSRTPRKIVFRRGMQMSGPGGKAPQTVGGRRAHPPKAEKDFSKDINEKERRKAIRSAISATKDLEKVKERGHKVDGIDLPLVVEDSIEEKQKTAEVIDTLVELGLEKELKRCEKKKVRAGKGKNRGRKYKRKTGPLIVVGEDRGIKNAARNLPGVEAVEVENLNAEMLAPGTHVGRLTVWSENAIEKLEEENLFN